MGISPKLLSPGERVIVSTRTHWKALIFPALVFIVTAAVTGFIIGLLPSGWTALLIVVLTVAVAVVLVWTVRPFVMWLSASYTLTDRRLIDRSGILVRKGRDIPLQRITQVSSERGVLDRVLGCGTLIVADASDRGHSTLHDVPHVEELQVTINNLLFATHDGTDDDGAQTSRRPPAT